MTPKQTLRILDANFNRSREGLRVCEEITRFVLNDDGLTRSLKKARHDVTAVLKELPVTYSELVKHRNTRGDVGRPPSRLERSRDDSNDLFLANSERVKESLRVLEETSKCLDAGSSARFKKIRFEVYAIEKKTLSKLETLRHHRPSRTR